jgi:hypothetical protein
MEVLNKLYVRNIKEILTEPTTRFHTQVLAPKTPITCNRVEQTLSTQLYSIRLTRQEERKESKDYARLSGLWVYCTARSIAKSASLYFFLLAVFISSLTDYSM